MEILHAIEMSNPSWDYFDSYAVEDVNVMLLSKYRFTMGKRRMSKLKEVFSRVEKSKNI